MKKLFAISNLLCLLTIPSLCLAVTLSNVTLTNLTSTPTPFLNVWAQDGLDKVLRKERRMTEGTSVINGIWDGTTISLWGAKNEVVVFNLVLESNGIDGITVEFDTLDGPGAAEIVSNPEDADDYWNFVGRDIELFYVRYMQIKGISQSGYNWTSTYELDDLTVPDAQIPVGSDGSWGDRRMADAFYPDIAVPLALESPFEIKHGNQQIWCDIWIPDDATVGDYTGTVTIKQDGVSIKTIPVELEVLNITLPDDPNCESWISYDDDNMFEWYLYDRSWKYPTGTEAEKTTMETVWKNQMKLAWRHKIVLSGNCSYYPGEVTTPKSGYLGSEVDDWEDWVGALDGTLFSAAEGYDGPGHDTGIDFWMIGLYSAWRTAWGERQLGEGNGFLDGSPHYASDASADEEAPIKAQLDGIANWFDANYPDVEIWWFTLDEPSNDADKGYIQQWAEWAHERTGGGSTIKNFCTTAFMRTFGASHGKDVMPDIDIFNPGGGSYAYLNDLDTEIAAWRAEDPGIHDVFKYNGNTTGGGTFRTEDEGVALVTWGWSQFKKTIPRWYYWECTNYNNSFKGYGAAAKTDVWNDSHQFGNYQYHHPSYGETGYGLRNGDGVLMFPGIDLVHGDGYDLPGPMISLRVKYWRRGIQDFEYLTQAAAENESATDAIVDAIIPETLWENDSYGSAEIFDRWSGDPDVWRAAREDLADIILGN